MIKLPRLPYGWKDQPQLFERYWDEAMAQTEKTLNAVLGIPAIEASIAAAQAAADNANAAADNANANVESQKSEASLASSYVDTTSYTGALLTCDNAGLVTIKTHTRKYGDAALNPNVSVTGGTFTLPSFTAGDIVRVYYSDATRAGGTVSYLYTVDPAAPPVQTGSTHSVGAVKVPVSGVSDGEGIKNPGYIYL